MVLLANQSIIFQRTNADGTTLQVPAQVQIVRASVDAHIEPYALEYQWKVVWDSPVQYSDGTLIQGGDQVLWSQLNNGQSTIYRPRIVTGLLPISVAYLKEEE